MKFIEKKIQPFFIFTNLGSLFFDFNYIEARYELELFLLETMLRIFLSSKKKSNTI